MKSLGDEDSPFFNYNVKFFWGVHDVESIYALVSHGASIHARDLMSGQTVMEHAIDLGDQSIMTYLVQLGALVNLSQDDQARLLMQAVTGGNRELVGLLLGLGVNCHWVDRRYNASPFQWAQIHHSDIFK